MEMAACGALFVWFLVDANKKISFCCTKITANIKNCAFFSLFLSLCVFQNSLEGTFMVRVANKWGWVALLHNIHARFINIISFLHNKFSIIIFQRKARWKILFGELLSLVGGLRIFFIIKLAKPSFMQNLRRLLLHLRWGFFIIVILALNRETKSEWIKDEERRTRIIMIRVE